MSIISIDQTLSGLSTESVVKTLIGVDALADKRRAARVLLTSGVMRLNEKSPHYSQFVR